ncbi:MAG TPA: TetR/AcrR family transcriptional regulator [Terracidiphilus sp.]|nr:TetR/AcrR family transcriptional regulator [Terracidiphilus sp.]
MPYPPSHRTETRKRIVDSARRLFNLRGFDNVSIAQIMAGAKLTHGGFYSYFQCKSDLYAEVLNCFFTDPEWKNNWDGVSVDMGSKDVGAQVVNAYLSRQHLESIENCCPMIALPTDVARSGPVARKAFERVFEAMVTLLERSTRNGRQSRRNTAHAIAALSIGGMVVARVLVNRAHADELRESCLQAALQLGGWPKPSNVGEAAVKRRSKNLRSKPAV